MATLDVMTLENRKAGTLELSPGVFEAPVKPHLFHAEVRRQLSARRGGTHGTKNRAAVSGGGAKPWRQKGTGRARQGTTRAPQWAGGGVVFGPVPRSYEHSLPKKVRRAALRAALSQKVREGEVTVVEALALDAYSTKRMAAILKELGLSDEGTLIVIEAENPKVEVSARNLPRVAVIRAAGLNVLDVLRHRHLVLTRGAVAAIEQRLDEALRKARTAPSESGTAPRSDLS
jgi:large subunit ribosomal protein L4